MQTGPSLTHVILGLAISFHEQESFSVLQIGKNSVWLVKSTPIPYPSNLFINFKGEEGVVGEKWGCDSSVSFQDKERKKYLSYH